MRLKENQMEKQKDKVLENGVMNEGPGSTWMII